MDNSPFAKLPAELQNLIWEMALLHPTSIVLCGDGRPRPIAMSLNKSGPGVSQLLALTATCKAIHSATSEMFYHINTFSIFEPHGSSGDGARPSPEHIMNRFRTWLTRRHAAALGRVVIYAVYPTHYSMQSQLVIQDTISLSMYQALEGMTKIAKLIPRAYGKIFLYGANGSILKRRSFEFHSWEEVVRIVTLQRDAHLPGSDMIYAALEAAGARLGLQMSTS